MKQNRVPKIEYSGKEPSKFRANHRSKDRIVDGLVFTDPRGQWAHPGQITEIPGTSSGTSITMNGVNYPVQGIDDTGYSQMMYPGMDYQFPGNYVTEYPMARYGGDPSLNNIEGHYPFGGQNTKTHTHMANGGWLDKLPEAQLGRIVKAGLKGVKKLNPVRIADKVVPQVGGLLNPAVLMGVEDMNAMSMSPLNWIPGYGKKLKGEGQAFRKFGNDLQHVKDAQVLSPAGGSKMRIGRDQIVNEGNWAQPNEVNNSYPGVFEATVNPQVKGTNLNYKAIHNRNGVLITDAKGERLPEIPITDPGLSFNRRLPFSNRYVPINKEKLIKKEFDLARTAPHLQSLAEKALGAAGVIAVHDYMQGDDKSDWFPQIKNQLDKSYNKVSKYVGPYLPKEEDGGWLDTMQVGGTSKESTSVRKPNLLNANELANARPYQKLSKEDQMAMYVDSAIANRQPDELRKTKKQGFSSKAHDVVMNPFKAAGYLSKYGRLPDNFTEDDETNALDFAPMAINPLTYLEAGYNTGKALFDPETYKDLVKTAGLGVTSLAGEQAPDEWKQAGLNTLFKGLDASMVKGAGKMVSKNAKRIINKNINKTSKNIQKGLDEQASRYYQNTPGKSPVVNHPTGKMEGIGDIKDIKRSLMKEDQYLKPSEYNSKAIPFSSYKPQAGGYTDVPQFNKQIQDLKTQAEFGKRPLGKNVKTNPATSKNALMEALDNARYEEGMTDLLPMQYMKQAKIPYNAKKAFQNIQPNKYGGLIMQKGGRTPIVVDDKNNSRLKAYNDSLTLYNLSQKAKKLFMADPSNEVLQGYNKKANDLSSKSKIKPNKIQLMDREYKYPEDFNPGFMEEAWLATYKKPVQPYIYKKPEEKEQSRTDIYTDKDLYDKAYKAEQDSAKLYEGYLKNIEGKKKTYFEPPHMKPQLVETGKMKNGLPVLKEIRQSSIWGHENDKIKPIGTQWVSEKYNDIIGYDENGNQIGGLSVSNEAGYNAYKKPVVHNVYQPPPPEKEPIKDSIPYKPKPKSIKSDTTRQWNFNGINPIMEYYDKAGKPLYQEYFKDMNDFAKSKKIEPLKKEMGGWLDTMQDGGTEENPIELPEVKTTPMTGAILNYEDANPKESYINNLKQAYLNNRNTQGLNKLAGLSMENFPSNVEQEYANDYLYKRNNALAPNIINSYSKSGDRTEWVDKLTEEEKDIIKNSDYRFDLEPNAFATSAAGLSKMFNYTGMPERYNAKMLGITENESKDIGKLNLIDFLNVPGQALGSALRSPNLPGSPNNTYMNNSMMKGLQGYHDPQRLAGEEILANPLNWTLGYDAAALSYALGKGLSKVPSLVKQNSNVVKKQKGLTWLKDWYNDPITIQKLKELKQYDNLTSNNEAVIYSDQIHPGKRWSPEDVNRLKLSKSDDLTTSLSHYDTMNNDGSIIYGDTYVGKMVPQKSTAIHEGTHQLTHNGGFFNKFTEDLLQQGFKKNKDEVLPGWSGKIDKSYWTSPTEIHARISEIRNKLGLKPSDVVTKKMLNKVFMTLEGLEMLPYIKNKSLFLETLNKIPAVLPVAIGASALQEEDGGFLEDEYRRGGQKRKKYTSKNIQSSVNDLFTRNETLFGPAGKKRYKPGLKYKSGGGWLDNLH